MRHKTLKSLVRSSINATEWLVGRRRVAKLARFVTNEVRLDVDNHMITNGEAIVQSVALSVANPTILDVGARYGEWSKNLLSRPGNTPIIHLFEPSAYSASLARSAIGSRGQVHQMALSDAPGTGELLIVHEGSGANSVIPYTDQKRVTGLREPITFGTVDDFCFTHGIEQIRLLKVDAEGHDLAILRGSKQMLERRAVDLVQFEYNSRWIDARIFLLDAFELLGNYGYRLGKITPRGIETYDQWNPELEKFVEGNYLGFLPKLSGDLPLISWWGP